MLRGRSSAAVHHGGACRAPSRAGRRCANRHSDGSRLAPVQPLSVPPANRREARRNGMRGHRLDIFDARLAPLGHAAG